MEEEEAKKSGEEGTGFWVCDCDCDCEFELEFVPVFPGARLRTGDSDMVVLEREWEIEVGKRRWLSDARH